MTILYIYISFIHIQYHTASFHLVRKKLMLLILEVQFASSSFSEETSLFSTSSER